MTCNYLKPHPLEECRDDWWLCGWGVTRIGGEPKVIRHGDVSNPMDDLEICQECPFWKEGDVDDQ